MVRLTKFVLGFSWLLQSKTIQSKSGRGYVKASVMVRASLEDAAAYLFDYESRSNRAFGDHERRVLNRNDFELHVKRKVILESKYSSFQQECEFYSAVNLYVVDDDTIAIVIDPVKRNVQSSTDATRRISFRMSFSTMGKVDGEERSTIILKRAGKFETKIEFATELEFGMMIGKAMVKKELENHLHGFKNTMPSYFLNILSRNEPNEINEKDGVTLGELLYEGGRANIKEAISNSAILSSVQAEFPWFEAILDEVLRNKLRPGYYSSATNADCLSITEARRMGGTLAMSLATNATAAGAVDEWFLQQNALQEIDSRFRWIRSMMDIIALKLVGDVGWGLKFRVFFGAALSTLDLTTDLYISYTFWKGGEKMYTFFKSSIVMLVTSMSLSLIFVLLQNKRRGWKTILLEMIPVVVGLKPAVDAFRVASGAKMAERQSFDPLSEMTYIRGIEMFSEAIPGVIIQLSAMLSFGSVSMASIISLVTSALTTGFISSSLSYDWDTDPKKRAESSEFYGYIPSRARLRAVVFVLMILISAIMLIVRASAIALLGHISKSAVFAYIFIDMCLYLIFKMVRDDFFYWLPLHGWVEMFFSFMSRIMVKIIVDFTGNGE